MASDRLVSAEQYADAERDALAMLAAWSAGDAPGAAAVGCHASAAGVVTVLLTLLVTELEAQGLNPVTWVSERQALALALRLE